jgi:hypothetical protein
MIVELLALRKTNLRRAFWNPARRLLIFMRLWHRLDRFLRASVGHELHASLPVVTLYVEALAELIDALARPFLLVIVMVVHCLSP